MNGRLLLVSPRDDELAFEHTVTVELSHRRFRILHADELKRERFAKKLP